MKASIIFILIIFYHQAWAQFDKPPALTLTILEDSLRCHPCTMVTISFKLSNQSNEDILIYSLRNGGPHPVFRDLGEYCNPNGKSSGTAFGLFGSDGSRTGHEIWLHSPGSKRHVTRAMVDSALNAAKIGFLESALILKGREDKVFTKEIPLGDFNLDKGIQYLQIVYYAGIVTASMPEVKAKSTQEHATLFQGCAMSQRIPLIIQ